MADGARRWGPPAPSDDSGGPAYLLCANRNERSLAIDLMQPRAPT